MKDFVSLSVNEIFCSIQGESTYAGFACAFVRLAGCNLRCRYCDTAYAREPGASMSMGEIISRLEDFKCPLIEVTGGEPLIQEEAPELIRLLLDRGSTVLLETNGSRDISAVDPRCVRIVDIKCPGSGEEDKNDFSNLQILQPSDQLKFVITNRNDYEYAKKILADRCRGLQQFPVLFSPAYGMLEPSVLASWILEDRLAVRLQLQLHKYIWPGCTRGV